MAQDPKQRDVDLLVELAAKNPGEGHVEEPRVYYDVLTLPANGSSVRSDAGVFHNGERYPVVMTHVTAFVRPDRDASPPTGTNELAIQQCGMRVNFSETFYQGYDFFALPVWHNVVNAGNPIVSRAQSHYVFDRPVILSARDALDVRVRLEQAPTGDATQRAEVTFEGTGLISGRPYVLTGSLDLADELPRTIPSDRYYNGGAEPIALTDMTVYCGAQSDDTVGRGDVRDLRVSCRVIGNGTQAQWFTGPVDPPLPEIPAALLGKTTGRCVVHRFPGKGLFIEPGRDFYVEAQSLGDLADGVELAVAFHGTIILR